MKTIIDKLNQIKLNRQKEEELEEADELCIYTEDDYEADEYSDYEDDDYEEIDD